MKFGKENEKLEFKKTTGELKDGVMKSGKVANILDDPEDARK